MTESLTRSIRCGLIGALALGVFSGVANAQEGEEPAPDIHNVLLTFHLVQADGFTDEDPEISHVVSELRKLFNFEGYRLLSTSIFNIGMERRGTSRTYVSGDGLQRIFPVDSETPLTIEAEVSSRRSPPGTVRASVTLTGQTTERVTEFSFTRELPLLEASVTIRDGQTMVVGSPRRTAGEPVLFLIVTTRIDP